MILKQRWRELWKKDGFTCRSQQHFFYDPILLQANAERLRIEGHSAIEEARLKAAAEEIIHSSELNIQGLMRHSELGFVRQQNQLEILRAQQLADIEVRQQGEKPVIRAWPTQKTLLFFSIKKRLCEFWRICIEKRKPGPEWAYFLCWQTRFLCFPIYLFFSIFRVRNG